MRDFFRGPICPAPPGGIGKTTACMAQKTACTGQTTELLYFPSGCVKIKYFGESWARLPHAEITNTQKNIFSCLNVC